MRTRTRGSLAIAGMAVLAMTAAACSSSSSSGGTGNNTAGGSNLLHSGVQALNPGTGSPKMGGTLNMLGDGDVDYICLLYTSPSPRDGLLSRMPSSA